MALDVIIKTVGCPTNLAFGKSLNTVASLITTREIRIYDIRFSIRYNY
jgi:hypothetical protein